MNATSSGLGQIEEDQSKVTVREDLLKQRENCLAQLARIDTCLVSGNPILDMTREQTQKFSVWF